MAKHFVPKENTQCIGTPEHPWNTIYTSNNIYSSITNGIVFESTIENVLYQIGWDNTNKLFYKLIDGVRTDIKDPALLPSGRKLYRHPTLPGSVIVFNDGIERKVLVLDAQYRVPSNQNNTSPINAGITAVTMPTQLPIYPTDDSATDYTDAIINAEIVKDTQTSKELTDKLMAVEADTGIAHKCRSITLSNGQSCDLPNINTLIRIAILASRIDSLDPTLSGRWSLVDTFQISLEEIPEIPDIPVDPVAENSITPRAWAAFMGAMSSSQGVNKYPLSILKETEGYRPYNSAQLWYGNVIPILELTE